MTSKKKHLEVLKDLRIQHEAYMSTNQNAKMYEKEDKDIADALDYVISVLEQEPILDKVRAEIERQEKWLMNAGCNQYNVDVALYTIKSVVDKYKAESLERGI